MNGEASFQLGRFLVVAGVLLVGLGLVFMAISRFSFFHLRHLPGDIAYRGKHFQFYFPIVSCLIVSVALTAILWLISILTRR